MASQWQTQRDCKFAKLLAEARGSSCTVPCYFLECMCACTSALLKSRFSRSFSSVLCCWTAFWLCSVGLISASSATAGNVPWFFGSFHRFFFFLHMLCAGFCCLLVFVLVTFCNIWLQLTLYHSWSVLQFSEVSLLYIPSGVYLLHTPWCIFQAGFWLDSLCGFSALFGPIWPLCYLEDLLGRFRGGCGLFGEFLQAGECLGFLSCHSKLLLWLPIFSMDVHFLGYIFLVLSGQMPLSSDSTMSQLWAWPWFAWHWARTNISCLSAGLTSSVLVP